MLVPKLLLTPQKNLDFWLINGQIRAKIVFLAKYWHFWPVWFHAEPKKQLEQGAKVVFLLGEYQNYYYYIFGHFGSNIGISGSFRPMPDQNTMQTRCLGGFSVRWVPKLLLSPVKNSFFALKLHNFAQN